MKDQPEEQSLLDFQASKNPMASIDNVGSTLSTSPDKKSFDTSGEGNLRIKIISVSNEEEKKDATPTSTLQYMSPSLRKKISQKRLLQVNDLQA